jgi:hypothetical protein
VDFLLIRSYDHLVLGLSCRGLQRSGRVDPEGVPELVAGDGPARLVLTLPPQHVAEETSRPGSPAPLLLPSERSVGPVPVWRAVLAGPTRLAVTLPRGTKVVPTVRGILDVLRAAPVSPPAGVPLADETAVELPWRMIWRIDSSPVGPVALAHRDEPWARSGVTGLWYTRIAASGMSDQLHDGLAPRLELSAVDEGAAGQADPPFRIPLARGERQRLFFEASRRPALASRLELTSLGATLSARGAWDRFQWQHSIVLGRDMQVRTLAKGVVYPLGHRAEYQVFTERIIDQAATGAAVLRTTRVLTITEPVRPAPTNARVRRAFPFEQVTLTQHSFPDLAPAAWVDYPVPGTAGVPTYFWPASASGPLAFPVECATAKGVVRFEMPLIFVADLTPQFPSLTDPGVSAELATAYGDQVVHLAGERVDLVRSSVQRDGDVHELTGITVGGHADGDGYRPLLTSLQVAVPALRTLLGQAVNPTLQFTERYLRNGDVEDVVLQLAGTPLDINFLGRSDHSGGLVAPRYVADGFSRTLGPVSLRALPSAASGFINPARLFSADATLLGFSLRDLVTELRIPPQITSVLVEGRPPEVTMAWHDVKLTSVGPFETSDHSRLDLTVTASPTGSTTTCVVSDFALVIPPGSGRLLRLHFDSITFTQSTGRLPSLDVTGVSASFLGDLQLLEELQDAVHLAAVAPRLDVTPTGIRARYSLTVPPVTAGAFVMRNIILSAGIVVPFDGGPVTISLAFASRATPFTMSVLMFGGTGYVELDFDHAGLQRLEAALEFGALVAIDFLVASGEVHALGGVRFSLQSDGSVSLTGYLRIGGCIDVLGLVSVSVELRIALAYQSGTKALVGRATLVVEIDLTLWSDSVELDSGEWVLAGGSHPAELFVVEMGADDYEAGLARWRHYRAAFATSESGSGDR